MPRCKGCNENFEQYEFNNKFCKEIDCQTAKAMHLLEKKKEQDEKDKNKQWVLKKQAIKDKNGWNTKKPPKNVLQDEINKLVRLIDNSFKLPCISCGNTNKVKYDAGHRRSVSSNLSLRYNLHNIHKQCSKNCNVSLSGNPDGYDLGLIERYGLKYKTFVKYDLQKEFDYVNLGGLDYVEKIKLVRKLIRDFDTFVLTTSISARCMFNNIIGIYKTDIGEIDLIESKKDDNLNTLF